MLWGDSIGAKYIHGKLQEWTKRYGSFFEPCSYLAERAAKGIPLVSLRAISFQLKTLMSIFFSILEGLVVSISFR